jgi:RPA family protein
VPDLWVPGAAPQSLDDFVSRVHKQIERYTETHAAEQSEVEVELADGERHTLQSISAEPGYGFVTLTVHPEDEDDPTQLIVPLGAIRRITLGPAEAERAQFGFALPDQRKEAEPAAQVPPLRGDEGEPAA